MSRGYLLDTVTVSEGTKARANSGLAAWLNAVDEQATYIAALTVGELQKGISRLDRASPRKAALERWLTFDLIPKFGSRVLAFDVDVARVWGTMVASALDRNETLPIVDSQIAAIASLHGLTVVTRNDAHFSRSGVSTLNPWT